MVRERNEQMSLAWHVAALMRSKKLPKLEKLMQRTTARRRQTPDEMLAIAAMIVAAHGGDVKIKRV